LGKERPSKSNTSITEYNHGIEYTIHVIHTALKNARGKQVPKVCRQICHEFQAGKKIQLSSHNRKTACKAVSQKIYFPTILYN